jgi:hypothetical protein
VASEGPIRRRSQAMRPDLALSLAPAPRIFLQTADVASCGQTAHAIPSACGREDTRRPPRGPTLTVTISAAPMRPNPTRPQGGLDRCYGELSDNDPGAELDSVPFLDRADSAPNGQINGRERLNRGHRLLWLESQDGTTDCTSVVLEAASYCQVVGRTWNPKLLPDGSPVLMNVMTKEPPTAMVLPIQRALERPIPREWAPPDPGESDGWPAPGTNPPPPAYWLPQLDPPRKKGKATEKGKRRPGITSAE